MIQICGKQQQRQEGSISMSNVQRKSDIVIERHQSIDCNKQNSHYLQIRKKYKKQKSKNTRSLQSLEVNRCSLNLPENTRRTQKRKLHSIQVTNCKTILTERPQTYEQTAKINYPKLHQLKFRHVSDRMHTMDEASLECKETKLKNCIQLMQGVLEQIKNQKSSRGLIKNRIRDEFSSDKRNREKEETQSGSQSKFESYVKTITAVKHDNKVLLLKKAKSRSILNKENMRSSIMLNADRFETIIKGRLTKQEKKCPTAHRQSITATQKDKVGVNEAKRLDDIECSAIDNVNQSSFISSVGKRSLIRHLEQQSKENLHRQKSTIENRKMLKINSKRLKSIFPDDFF